LTGFLRIAPATAGNYVCGGTQTRLLCEVRLYLMKTMDMRTRDAVVGFHCGSPDLIQVSEVVAGKSVHHPVVPRNMNVVSELEERYIFFANQADIARKKVKLGQSCVFSVYFREP
jgi:hypothetical protein